VIVVALVLAPAYILHQKPADFGVTTQVLFSILLFGASMWFGFSFNTTAAQKEVASRWLPAAESACKELITISLIADRIHRVRGQNRERVLNLLKQLPPEQRQPISTLTEAQCGSCADRIATLRAQVDTSIAGWEVFIGKNCTGNECAAITGRLDAFRGQQQETLTPMEPQHQTANHTPDGIRQPADGPPKPSV